MSFNKFKKDTVSLQKESGETIHDIKAQINKENIIITNPKISVVPGDIFKRSLPMGGVEEFHVIDPHYQSRSGTIPNMYVITFSKNKPKVQASDSINIRGDNNSVYLKSTNHSININGLSLDPLVNIINRSLSGNDKVTAEKLVAEIQDLIQKPEPDLTKLSKAIKKLKGYIPLAASCSSLISELVKILPDIARHF